MEIILSLVSILAYTLLVRSPRFSIAFDTSIIAQSHPISDGHTIVSQNRTFELGFFSPGHSKNRYLEIWYKNISVQTVVWVANGRSPINDSSARLELNSTGNLVLTHHNTVVWCTTTSSLKAAQARNPVAELLDSGNLVIREQNDGNPEAYLWQSFDYPSNTMLAGMKLGWDLRRHLNRNLTAWKSEDDPAPSDFSWSLVLHNYPEIYMMRGSKKFHRLGPWNGLRFSGMPELKINPIFDFKFVSNEKEVYYTWSLKSGSSLISMTVLNQTSSSRPRYVWSETYNKWMTYSKLPEDYCDTYGLCGPNGFCSITESPVCQCMKGFRPKSPEGWNAMDWSQGCVRHYPLSCKDKLTDGFVNLEGFKVPDTEHTLVDETIGLEECRAKCLNDCSCTAFTNSDISGAGRGCVMWFGNLVDIKQFPVGGQNLNVRMTASELEAEKGRKKNIKIVATTIAAASGMLSLAIYCMYRFRRNIVEKPKTKDDHERHVDDVDLPLYGLPTITTATNNFSTKNKIGEGGFGSVYKGKLADGQEIAVKRLSRSSEQGMTEFINEVKLIAKIQHRNLVKLLGCCVKGQEKMLVYEFMANGSLDSFIFDHMKGRLLEWSKRFHIICGIARGLMYLHQDSRLRIIHRDVKASNVLLDDELNPKISDFGMARTFGGNQIEGNTNRVVGTYGYMAPEYAIDGKFSIKSDVFSFGILLLEIICGKRNRGRYSAKETLNLVGHAWTLWNVGRAIQIIDSNIEDSCVLSEVLRCIHVSLLCVQQYPEDRPTMTSVVLMLESEKELVEPKEPGFFTRNTSVEASSSSSWKDSNSNNEMTITLLNAR